MIGILIPLCSFAVEQGYAVFDSETGTLTFKYGEKPDGENVFNTDNTDIPSWRLKDIPELLKKVVFDNSFVLARPQSTSQWFLGAEQLAEIIGLEYLNTTEVKSMRYMFYNCSSLTNVDISNFDSSNLEDTNSMFSGCNSLTSIKFGDSFKASHVKDMEFMFNQCSSLATLNLSTFESVPESMAGMFSGCKSLISVNFGGIKTKDATNMSGMFLGCSSLTDLDLSGFDTSNVANMEGMFNGCSSLATLDISSFDTSKVTNMHYMFYGCSNLISLDLSNFDTGNVTSLRNFLAGCSGLKEINLNNFDTHNVTNMESMFAGCSNLNSLDLSSFNTSKVTNMSWMFYDCSSLINLDVSSFDTGELSDMTLMFNNCSSLKELDLSSFDTHNVTTMGGDGLFRGCTSLESINLSNFDISNVTTLAGMFYECRSLKSLDLSNFNTSKVTNMGWMFYGCSSLSNLDLSNFDTSSVINMSGMFWNCLKLEKLDLSNFETSNVTSMNRMFFSCSFSSIDLSSFDVKNIADAMSMFEGCMNLKTIYVGEKWTGMDNLVGFNMFAACENLVGGKGSAYDAEHTSGIYARIDGGPEAPGYFTEKKTEGDIVTFTTNKGLTFEGNKSTEEAVLVSMDKFTEGEVIIPEAVVNEGTGYKVIALQKLAFSECAKIERITLAKSIKRIELPVFQGCSSLCAFEVVQPSDGNFVAVDGVLFSDLGTEEECMIVYPAAKGAEYEIPETVKRIGAGAFASAQLSSLTVRFSEPVDITTDVLEGLDLDNCVLNVPMGTSDKYRDHEVWGLFKNIVGESSIKVDDAVFKVTEDGSVVFSDIDKAKVKGDYIIPGTIIVDGNSVPVTEIAPHAFEGCEDLVSVSIPENIKKIGAGAFKGCKNLEEIFCFSPLPIDLSILSGTRFAFTRSGDVISQFEGIDFETCILYVPTGSAEYYRNADGWKEFKNIVEMDGPESITISSAKQVTYMSDKDLDFTGYPDLKAYVATGYDKNSGTIWLTRVKEVPANTGFLLMGEADTYEIPVKAGGLSAYYQNMFKGTLEATTIYTTDGDYTNYYLSNGESGVGFYKVTKEEGVTLGKNRAYLPIPTEIPVVGTAGSTEMIKVSSAGQVPYCNSESLDFSSLDAQGVKAYTATGYDYNSGTIWLTRVKQVPAETGILIMAPQGEYPVPTASVASVYANMFKGTLPGTTIQTHETIAGEDYINYYLSSGDAGVGFYKVTKEGGVTIGANRCYLPILNKEVAAGTRSSGSGQNQIAFREAEEVIGIPLFRGVGENNDGTTNLTPALSKGEGEWYTLQGQRVAKPGKGLYIRNGKVVVIK